MKTSLRFLLCFFATLAVGGAVPGWWSDGVQPVLSEASPNNKGAANVGQGKWIATSAMQALIAELGQNSPVVQAIEDDLFKGSESDPEGVFFPGRPEVPDSEWLEAQRNPLQIGALKALAAPFYRHLSELDAGWVEGQLNANGLLVKGTDYFEDTDGTFYPWNPADNANTGKNRSLVSIGQLKLVFSFDISTIPGQGIQFVTLPVNNSEVLISDGVIAAFDLPSLALPGNQLPSRIDLSVRPHGTSQPWLQIGRVTEFAVREGVEFVRGSTVWIPQTAGVYEVKADAYDPIGEFVASNVRKVTVQDTHAPSIEIVSGPDSPSASPVAAAFATLVSDIDPGDAVQSVAFYDNGILIGVDYSTPFGDSIGGGSMLYKGSHSITATAFDLYSKSTVSNTYQVEITGGDSRPSLAITSPVDGTLLSPNTDLVIGLTPAHPDSDAFVELKARVLETSAEVSKTSAPFNSLTIPHGDLQEGENTIVITIEDDDQILSYEAVLRVRLGSTLPDLLVAEIADEATVTTSNVRYRGASLASGIFSGGSVAGLQMESGSLLTSGASIDWDGNDVSEGQSTQWGSEGDEKLANRIVGTSTEDAAVLEFDVECDHSQMELEVQFGSEEYTEFIGSFNDAFVVTVDDAVISLTPDGGDIIALHSVTPDFRGHLYMDDDDDIDPVASSTRQVEYDGVTFKLRLHAFVTPGQTHKVRIVIADVNDAQLDSGLFLESASLRSVDP